MWRNGGLRRLWLATTLDGFGSWLLVMAVPTHVFAVTGSAMSTGLALALEALPAVLIGPWAGVAIDRWPRGDVLVAANLVGAAGVALMLTGGLPYVYLGLVVESVAVCFLRPAVRAVLPAIAGGEADLAAANAALAVTNSVLRICGPLLGTLLVARGWFAAVVLVDAASYIAAAAVVLRLVVRPVRVEAATAGELRAGLRHIGRTPLLRGLLATSWVFWTANAGLTALLVPFVATRLHEPGQAVGYLVTGLGAGYLAGSAISRALISRYATRTVLAVAYASVGVCFLVLFTATALPVALVAVTASGVPGAAALVLTGHRIQTSTPDAALGRVSAAFYASDAVAAVAGALAGPGLAALAGLGVTLTVLSGAVLAAAAMAAVLVPAVEHRVREPLDQQTGGG